MIEEALTHSSLATLTQFISFGEIGDYASFSPCISQRLVTDLFSGWAIASGWGLPLEFTMIHNEKHYKKKKRKKKAHVFFFCS